MFTIEMEIKNEESNNAGFYVPATKDFKKYPRTMEGVNKAIVELCKNLNNENLSITDFNIIVYEGKVYHYTPNRKILMKLDDNLNKMAI